MFSSAEYIVCLAVWNSLVGLNTAFALRAAPALWRANKAWSFADDLLGGGFRDQVTLNLKLKALLEECGSLHAGHTQDGGMVDRAPVRIREADLDELITGFGFE